MSRESRCWRCQAIIITQILAYFFSTNANATDEMTLRAWSGYCAGWHSSMLSACDHLNLNQAQKEYCDTIKKKYYILIGYASFLSNEHQDMLDAAVSSGVEDEKKSTSSKPEPFCYEGDRFKSEIKACNDFFDRKQFRFQLTFNLCDEAVEQINRLSVAPPAK